MNSMSFFDPKPIPMGVRAPAGVKCKRCGKPAYLCIFVVDAGLCSVCYFASREPAT